MAQSHEQQQAVSAADWQRWAKKRAKKAPSLKRIHELARKVQMNVTQLILNERRAG